MTRLYGLTIAVAVLALPCTVGAQGFEGVIRTRTISVQATALERLGATTPEQVFALPIERILALKSRPAEDTLEDAVVEVTVHDEAVLSIKGTMIRTAMKGGTDAPDTTWSWILDLERGTWLVLQPSRRRYAEIASDDEPAGRQPKATRAAPANRARPLGDTRTIAGVRAAGYEVRSEFEIARGWMATQQDLAGIVRAFQKLASMWEEPADPDEEPDAEDLLLAHGFPMLRQTLEVQEGQPGAYEIEETVEVERRAMPAGLFVVPTGYRKVSLEELFAEFQPREP
jgi:hypothetical protein